MLLFDFSPDFQMPQQPAVTPTSVTGRRLVGGDEATGSISQTDALDKQHNSEYIFRDKASIAGCLCG